MSISYELEEGQKYIICLKPARGNFCKGSGYDNEGDYEKISNHRFFNNRAVTFVGYDKEWKGDRKSYIFRDNDMKLIENIKSNEDFAAFMQITFICISHSDDDNNWIFHIEEDRFEVI